MKQYFFLLLGILIALNAFSQDSPFSVEINYGLAGNHFVGSYFEDFDDGNPDHLEGNLFLSRKDFLGTVSSIQVNYEFRNSTTLSFGYARDSHQRERDYQNVFNGVPVNISNWSIRHNNNIFFAKHKRKLRENLKYHFGFFVLHPEQQEIDIYEPPFFSGSISLSERDLPNNRLADGGFLGGLNYEKQIDTHFKAGLNLTGYHLTSAGTYETTYLTGSLAYTF